MDTSKRMRTSPQLYTQFAFHFMTKVCPLEVMESTNQHISDELRSLARRGGGGGRSRWGGGRGGKGTEQRERNQTVLPDHITKISLCGLQDVRVKRSHQVASIWTGSGGGGGGGSRDCKWCKMNDCWTHQGNGKSRNRSRSPRRR